MFRRVLTVTTIAVIVGMVTLIGMNSTWAQQNPSASRTISPTTVAPGGQVTVTISASGYGGFGRVTETLPAGFDYQGSNLDPGAVSQSGQNVNFTLLNNTSFTYTATASSSPGSYAFTGQLQDSNRNNHTIGGTSSVTVRAAAVLPTPVSTPVPSVLNPSASRSISPPSVGPGDSVTVTIRVNGYGGFGRVTETLPAGFTYQQSSGLASSNAVSQSGQNVNFTLLNDTLFTYTATASSSPGSYTFSGQLTDADGNSHRVRGSSSVTVRSPEASRSLPSSVRPGAQFSVSISVADYGPFGRVTENLPAGFSYQDSSLVGAGAVSQSGQTVIFTLQGDSSFSYTVTAPNDTGNYRFSGQLADSERNSYAVRGSSSIRVGAPSSGGGGSAPPEDTATPTPIPEPTPEPTTEPMATSTAEATATNTPVPEPTATNTAVPEPTATNTAVPEPTATNTPVPEPTATNTAVPEPTATYTAVPKPTRTPSEPMPQAAEPRATATPVNVEKVAVTPVAGATTIEPDEQVTLSAGNVTVRFPVLSRARTYQVALSESDNCGDDALACAMIVIYTAEGEVESDARLISSAVIVVSLDEATIDGVGGLAVAIQANALGGIVLQLSDDEIGGWNTIPSQYKVNTDGSATVTGMTRRFSSHIALNALADVVERAQTQLNVAQGTVVPTATPVPPTATPVPPTPTPTPVTQTISALPRTGDTSATPFLILFAMAIAASAVALAGAKVITARARR